jgi:hypothetical protein
MMRFATTGPTRRTLALAVFAALLAPSASAAAELVTSAAAPDLPEAARSLPRGASMRLEGAALEGRSIAGLDLVRFEPVADGARFVVQTASGPRLARPALPTYFRGSVDGMPGAVAVVSVHASGEVRGIVSNREDTWMLSRAAKGDRALRSRRAERDRAAASRKFECEALPAGPVPRAVRAASPAPTGSTAGASATPAVPVISGLPIAYTAQIALELDYEFYLGFAPDADAAILYALDLMAFTGSLGEAELGMNVQVPFVQLWTTAADPYSSTASARLGQVRSRWNQAAATNCGSFDCTSIARSTVLLLSSAPYGGVAFLPGLCDSWHSPTGGFSYGYAGSISGNFNIDSPTAVWDIMVTTHELGHNFGSPHTHCYDPPIDQCFGTETGCYAGPASALPSGCPGIGQGCATVMSYCHLLFPGMSNISLTYGAGHPYGVDPDRVPSTMLTQIASEALAAPGCLAATGGMVELEVTRTGGGSGTVTSSPAAIDCGSTCRAYFAGDSVVTLTATPGPFSDFAGWSGDPDCSDGEVTMSAAASCVATFEGNCGAGNDNCDDGDPCTEDTCPGDSHCENRGVPRSAASCFDAGKAMLKVTNSADPARDKFLWQWTKGDAFAQADLGDPSSSTDYRLCIYDSTSDVTELTAALDIPAGSPFWKNVTPRGWVWNSSTGAISGVRKVQLKTGALGRTKVKLLAAGTSLALPLPHSMTEFFDGDTSVTVQLFAGDDRCWTSVFPSSGISVNTTASFRATGN